MSGNSSSFSKFENFKRFSSLIFNSLSTLSIKSLFLLFNPTIVALALALFSLTLIELSFISFNLSLFSSSCCSKVFILASLFSFSFYEILRFSENCPFFSAFRLGRFSNPDNF